MDSFVTRENIEALKGTRSLLTPREENWAYLAGLIDAEGCFRVKKWTPKGKPNPVYAISLEIGNTKFPIFPWLMERLGGNISFIEAKHRKRCSAIWSLSAEALYKVLPNIIPFLRSKREVAEALMEFSQTIIPNGGDRHSVEFNRRYADILSKREEIVARVHKLNAKGVNNV